MSLPEKARAIRDSIPDGGLFSGRSWRIAPEPLSLPNDLFDQIVELGPRFHLFHKACNLLYRQSVEGKQPAWIHRYLDAGKPPEMIALAREKTWKNDLPPVIRPDLLLTEGGLVATELDSVPGGIGLTAWLQRTYAQNLELGTRNSESQHHPLPQEPLRMLDGFIAALRSAFQIPPSEFLHAAIVVSEEAREYRPEMEWLRAESAKREMRNAALEVCAPVDLEYRPDGVFLHNRRLDGVYRFFELFDLPNIASIEKLTAALRAGLLRVTPPLKPQLEEKLWFALFYFPQLADFWRRELGDRYQRDLQKIIPFTWLLDPAPLPPHAVIPHLEIQDWRQLAAFSQKQRDLILKISGFSERAWGSRGVFLGNDMPSDPWKAEVIRALAEFEKNPHILQRFAKTKLVEHAWYDFQAERLVPMKGRLRLCPYYFVEADKPKLGGILATLCPADKKLIHGMEDAILTLAMPEDSESRKQ